MALAVAAALFVLSIFDLCTRSILSRSQMEHATYHHLSSFPPASCISAAKYWIGQHGLLAGMREGMLLTSEQTMHIGTLLLDMLLKMKHNGAVDIAHEGLCSVVKR